MAGELPLEPLPWKNSCLRLIFVHAFTALENEIFGNARGFPPLEQFLRASMIGATLSTSVKYFRMSSWPQCLRKVLKEIIVPASVLQY